MSLTCIHVVFVGYQVNTKIKTYSHDIYVTSDLEGRFDLYLHFFIRIGLLNFSKFQGEINNIINALYQKIVIEQDSVFCRLLTEKINTAIISKAINQRFSGLIIINGDITSNRIGYIFNDNSFIHEIKDFDLIHEFNRCSVNLLKTLKDVMKDRLVIIAGNHDVHDSFSVHDDYRYHDKIKSLDDIKKYALENLSFYRFYKILIKNKVFVFKHSAGTLTQHFQEFLRSSPILITPSFVPRDKSSEEKYFWLYFYNSQFGFNETPEQILESSNVFLIHGHTHERPDNISEDGSYYLYKQLSQNRLCSDWHVHESLLECKKICYYHLDSTAGVITAKDFFSGKEYFIADPLTKQATFK